ncbi:MAG: chemotaxis response regulator protein-glutamate methylesterase [Thiohalomonadales bacterium]
MEKIKVMVVDDSAVIRQVMTKIIKSDPTLELFAAVADPLFAMVRVEKNRPDVIVLDVEMPRMDGITYLKKIMSEDPIPVVICSTLTADKSDTAMQAMAAGAIGFIHKPKMSVKGYLEEESMMVIDTIKGAAKANLRKIKLPPTKIKIPALKLTADTVIPSETHRHSMVETTQKIIAMGTSTGGTQALEYVLTALPRTSPGIIVVQHMPEKFTAQFARRLNDISAVTITEAKNGDRVLPGHVFIAPGGKHMLLKRVGAQYCIEIKDGPLVSRHRPSVDVLFRSVAQAAGKNALGIIMTGMGDDGALGMKEMHDAGSKTLAQDEKTCVVYGMPKEAVKHGGVDDSLPLQDIAGEIIYFDDIMKTG